VKNVAPVDSESSPAVPLRVLWWALAAVVLGATFAAYGQVDLLIQWVSAQLC
jgi:hypothetical protein